MERTGVWRSVENDLGENFTGIHTKRRLWLRDLGCKNFVSIWPLLRIPERYVPTRTRVSLRRVCEGRFLQLAAYIEAEWRELARKNDLPDECLGWTRQSTLKFALVVRRPLHVSACVTRYNLQTCIVTLSAEIHWFRRQLSFFFNTACILKLNSSSQPIYASIISIESWILSHVDSKRVVRSSNEGIFWSNWLNRATNCKYCRMNDWDEYWLLKCACFTWTAARDWSHVIGPIKWSVTLRVTAKWPLGYIEEGVKLDIDPMVVTLT